MSYVPELVNDFRHFVVLGVDGSRPIEFRVVHLRAQQRSDDVVRIPAQINMVVIGVIRELGAKFSLKTLESPSKTMHILAETRLQPLLQSIQNRLLRLRLKYGRYRIQYKILYIKIVTTILINYCTFVSIDQSESRVRETEFGNNYIINNYYRTSVIICILNYCYYTLVFVSTFNVY